MRDLFPELLWSEITDDSRSAEAERIHLDEIIPSFPFLKHLKTSLSDICASVSGIVLRIIFCDCLFYRQRTHFNRYIVSCYYSYFLS